MPNPVTEPAPQTDVAALATEPSPLSAEDFKRIAPCARQEGRFNTNLIALGPLGLVATDGRALCLIHAPGWPRKAYLDAQNVRSLPRRGQLALNGQIEFVTGPGAGTRVTVAEVPAEDARFPEWERLLPAAEVLAPVATFNIGTLKKLLAALQRDNDSKITFYVRTDCELVMLANEAGDLGLIMPYGPAAEHRQFPEAVYKALGKATETAPAIGAK